MLCTCFLLIVSLNLEFSQSYDQIEAYRMLSYKELSDSYNDRLLSKSYDELRLGRILMKLTSLAETDTNVIEEIFFVGLIGMFVLYYIRTFYSFFYYLFKGSVQISKIIPCILTMNVSSSPTSSMVKFENTDQ